MPRSDVFFYQFGASRRLAFAGSLAARFLGSSAAVPSGYCFGHAAMIVFHEHAALPAAGLLAKGAVASLLRVHRGAISLPAGVARQALASHQPRRLDAQRRLVPLVRWTGQGALRDASRDVRARKQDGGSARQGAAGHESRATRPRRTSRGPARQHDGCAQRSSSNIARGGWRGCTTLSLTRAFARWRAAARLVELVALRVAPLLLSHVHHLLRLEKLLQARKASAVSQRRICAVPTRLVWNAPA